MKQVVAALLMLTTFQLSMPEHAVAADAKDKRASALAIKALQLFHAKSYREAAELFLKAYELSLRPAQLRNAARAYEEGEMFGDALPLWERYQTHVDVTAAEAEEATSHIRAIRERQNPKAEPPPIPRETDHPAEKGRIQDKVDRPSLPVPALVTPPPAEASGSGAGLRWGLTGGGAGATIAGGILWFVAAGRSQEWEDRYARRDPVWSATEYEDQRSGINRDRVISGALLGLGVAALGTGIVLFLTDSSEDDGNM